MPASAFKIKLIDRLLKYQGIPKLEGDPSNCWFHDDRGRNAFWNTMSGIMDAVRLIPGDRRPAALAAYQAVCAAHRKGYLEAKVKAETNPDQDRAWATPSNANPQPKVLLIGYGYWGKKLAKTLHKLGVLGAVWDQNAEAREAALKDFPGGLSLGVHMESSTWKTCRELTHAVIATPPETHAGLASDTLKAGLHTFVEKPLATTREHALVLEDLARKVGRHLNTGHIYLHNPGLLYMADGRRPFTGRVRIDIQLLNVGGPPSQSTRDLMWAGMPHAISVGLYLTGQRPTWIEQTSHDVARYRNWRGVYLNGTEIYVTVADYTGVRRRLVRVEDSMTIFSFDADRPDQYETVNKATGQVRQPEVISENPRDPLTREMEAFLRGESDKVLASDVVAVIEDSIRSWEQSQKKP